MISIRVYPHTSANIKGWRQESGTTITPCAIHQFLQGVSMSEIRELGIKTFKKQMQGEVCICVYSYMSECYNDNYSFSNSESRKVIDDVQYRAILSLYSTPFLIYLNTSIIQFRETFPDISMWIITCTAMWTLASLIFPFSIHVTLWLCWNVPSSSFTCGSELIVLFSLLCLLSCHPWALQMFLFSGSREAPLRLSWCLQSCYSTGKHWRQFLQWIYPKW